MAHGIKKPANPLFVRSHRLLGGLAGMRVSDAFPGSTGYLSITTTLLGRGGARPKGCGVSGIFVYPPARRTGGGVGNLRHISGAGLVTAALAAGRERVNLVLSHCHMPMSHIQIIFDRYFYVCRKSNVNLR